MRVKVGDEWHESEVGKPIMVQLSEQDRKNIANMAPGCDRYACFQTDYVQHAERSAKLRWMDEGYQPLAEEKNP